MLAASSLYATNTMSGAFLVTGPAIGEVVGTSLHRAYDDDNDLPDDFRDLLEQLNEID